MSSIKSDALVDNEYRLVCVEKTKPPAGTKDAVWHRYVILRGPSSIVGNRCGTFQDVRSHATAFANDLNDRASNMSRSIWTRNGNNGQQKK